MNIPVKQLLLFFLIFHLFSCENKEDFKIPKNTSFIGKSTFTETGDSVYYKVKVLENDSIIILQSYKGKNYFYEDNIQYYGHLKHADSLGYKITPSIHFSAWGCDKPDNKYLNSDSIPIYINNNILDLFKNYSVEIFTENKLDTTININNSTIVFSSKKAEEKINHKLLFKTKQEPKLKSFSLDEVGLRCGVYIQNDLIRNYFLSSYNYEYILIREKLNYNRNRKDFRDTIYLEVK